MLSNLEVILVGTRFPENVGMAARACANMGCEHLTLAGPAWWDLEKARPLATAKGEPLLGRVRVCDNLAEALAPCVFSVGTTARTGGWRRELLTPEQAARELLDQAQHGRVALVMGPEDRGLTNDEIEHCQRLACIPTSDAASSLNVAQALLIFLYACRRADPASPLPRHPGPQSRRIDHAEQERLYTTLRETLLAIDFVKADNPDYFLLPLRRLLGRSTLRRHEMDMLMGICRQIANHIRPS